MTWSRFVKVNVAGTDVTADALDGVSVSNGGRTWWEQNVAGFARVTLFDESPNVTIGDTVTIEVESPEGVEATGGTVTTYTSGGVKYYVHTFTSTGNLVVTKPGDVDYLIIAGGGGGGGGGNGRGGAGGGGAGGMRTGTASVTVGTHAITVGAKGLGGAGNTKGADGASSSAFGIVSTGGGGGGSRNVGGGNGGSGGGGSANFGGAAGPAGTGIVGQGNNGGASASFGGGGGGGRNAVGANASGNNGGNGGAGLASNITGASVTYAGGGGGGSNGANSGGSGGAGGGGAGGSNASGANATGFGSGGGGGANNNTNNLTGGNGSDGIIIIRYPDPVVTVFTGTVSTIETQLTTAGPFWTIEATGPLATANRRVLLDTIPADTDGDQILALAIEALGTQWSGTPGAWDEQTFTWAQFTPDTSEIDTPGVYALAAITDTPSSIGDQLALAASSGQGWLYETPHGTLGYGDSTRRETTPAEDFITIPGSAVDLLSISAVVTDGDLVNRAIVSWSGGEETLNYIPSQSIYGLWERSYETTLDDAGDAVAYALRRVELDGEPRKTLPSGIRVDLRLLDDTTLDHLLSVRRNYGIIVEDMPTYLTPEGVFRGFVEGYTWTLGPIYPTLDLFLSDYALSVFGLRWAATGSVAWQDVDGTLAWQDTEETL